MIRYIYSMCFALICVGLPAQAKGTAPAASTPPPQPSTSKTNSDALAPAKPVASAKDKSDKTKPSTTTASNKPSTSSLPSSSNRTANGSMASSHGTLASPSRSRSTSGGGRLARLTAYWSGEGDYYTGRGMSSTGIHLHQGHCAVDPKIIPYGSVVEIAGLGKYLAVDTGSAVISREAARATGHTPEERSALVIDLYFESRRDGERFAASATKFAAITWTAPRSTASTQDARSLATE